MRMHSSNILAIIIHEISHLQENTKVRKYNTEGKLIKFSNYQKNYYNEKGDLNRDTYYTNPSEKIAFALSYKKLLEIVEKYPEFTKNYSKVYRNIRKSYLLNLKLGYSQRKMNLYNTPLVDFAGCLNDDKLLKRVKLGLISSRNIRKIHKLSLEERMMYGLPMTKRQVKILEKKY